MGPLRTELSSFLLEVLHEDLKKGKESIGPRHPKCSHGTVGSAFQGSRPLTLGREK